MTVTVVAAYAFDNIGGSIVPDLSGNGWDLTLSGTGGQVVSGGHTNGAFAKLSTGSMPVFPAGLVAATETDDRALMFWAEGDPANRTTWWVRWQFDSIGSGGWGILNLGDGVMKGQVRRNSDQSLATRPAATDVSASAWHHYCLRYQRSTGLIDLLRDGVLTTPGPPNGQSSFAANTQLIVGASRIDMAEWSSTTPAIDDLRMLSSWPTDAEVTTLMNTPVSASGRRKTNFFHGM